MEQHAELEGGFEALYEEMASVSKSLPLAHFFSHHLTGRNCGRLQFFTVLQSFVVCAMPVCVSHCSTPDGLSENPPDIKYDMAKY